jgi:(p)ppGpp synthase/HD superfamily hydrolase
MSELRTIPGFSDRFSSALEYAARVHRHQPRKGSDIPYVGHLLGVASIVIDSRGTEEEAIAALLHDAPEDHGGRSRLDEIGIQFGVRIADIVGACSDSLAEDADAKAPWRERKTEYIEHLKTITDKSVYLISAADKLHNARSTLVDLTRYGEAVWNNFKGKRDGSLWNYDALIEVYQHGPFDSRRDPIVEDLAQVVAELKSTTRGETEHQLRRLEAMKRGDFMLFNPREQSPEEIVDAFLRRQAAPLTDADDANPD